MASPSLLKGSELIDCARANGNQGIEVACQRCGYGEDLETFERELKKTCESMGINIQDFHDLVTDEKEEEEGTVIGPDTPSQL